MDLPWDRITVPERAVFLEVLRYGPISRADMSPRLGLSRASLSRLTRGLLDHGLLLDEAPTGPALTVGRPVQPLSVAPDLACFVGIKLTGDHAFATAVDLWARPIAQADAALRATEPGTVAARIGELVQRIAPDAAGVGISLGGISPDRRTIAHAPYLQWRDVPLAELVSAASGRPVWVENDLVALAEGEAWFGLGREQDRFAMLTLGEGVGGAAIADGRVLTSPQAGYGLLGHLPLLDGEPAASASGMPRCPAGHTGCAMATLTIDAQWEALRDVGIDVAGILDDPRTSAATPASPADRSSEFARVAHWVTAEGPDRAREVLDRSAVALGRLIAHATALIATGHVVIAGESGMLFSLREEAVRAEISDRLPPDARDVVVTVQEHSFFAWARAAAALAIQHSVQGD
jgi:predicted NBD/HSP70 family sugar kinase